jgi:hypothetical protein
LRVIWRRHLTGVEAIVNQNPPPHALGVVQIIRQLGKIQLALGLGPLLAVNAVGLKKRSHRIPPGLGPDYGYSPDNTGQKADKQRKECLRMHPPSLSNLIISCDPFGMRFKGNRHWIFAKSSRLVAKASRIA